MTRGEVEEEIRQKLSMLRVPQPEFRLPIEFQNDSLPFVEGEGPYFKWLRRIDGKTIDELVVEGPELVFLTMEHLTMAMARQVEKQTRTRKKAGLLTRLRAKGEYGAGLDNYSRKTWMDAHVRLMSAIHEGWGTRVRLKYDMMLKKFPLTKDERLDARVVDLTQFGID